MSGEHAPRAFPADEPVARSLMAIHLDAVDRGIEEIADATATSVGRMLFWRRWFSDCAARLRARQR